jgi:lysyl-tRNA synthetase class 2
MDPLIQERHRKLNDIKEMGINPYPYEFDVKNSAKELLEKNKGLNPETKTKKKAVVAGRIVLLRRMGKASFAHLQDSTGKIQLYIKQDNVGVDSYKLWKLMDLGDIIGVEGNIFATKTGEVTIEVKELTLLAKSLRPLPEKYHGLKDVEQRYRKRYVDLIVNPEVRDTFIIRSKVIRTIRNFLDSKGFLEVETPTLQPLYGGAAARPFTTFHNTLKQKLYLRISDELYLKRLVVGGFDKVYEICKDFRNEGVDTSHNPEFTMLEWYEAYKDYNHGMEMFETLIETAAKNAIGTTKVKFGKHNIDLKAPWKRLRMVDAVKKYTDFEIEIATKEEIIKELKKRKIDHDPEMPRGNLVQLFFEETCEEHLIQPTFIIDHPVESTPLCKPLRKGDPMFIERFEPYIAGMEVGNSYSELNDPILQRKLMDREQMDLEKGNEEASPLDEDFIEAMEQGMPPMSGVGIGIDRIVMIISGSESIRDVIFFPAMRPEE